MGNLPLGVQPLPRPYPNPLPIAAPTVAPTAAPTATPGALNQVGIWYSTWYALEGNYHWNNNNNNNKARPSALGRSFLADVNGDGRLDATTFSATSGSWEVALNVDNEVGMRLFSNHSGVFSTDHGIDSSMQFLVDVNGDDLADAVTFHDEGWWTVALSTGSAFSDPVQWRDGHGFGSTSQMMADVNGDGRSDAVVYFERRGAWYVSLSTGSSFLVYSKWTVGHGLDSTEQFLADVTGDGRADAVTFNTVTGQWLVAPSTGGGFGESSEWLTGLGQSSSQRLLADVNGDGKADAITFSKTQGIWEVAFATGASFQKPRPWKRNHGRGADAVFAGNLFGCGPEGKFGCNRADAVSLGKGSWSALPGRGYSKPNILNTWQGWNIPYIPRVKNSFRQYDSSETSVVDEHLTSIRNANIDFILMDQTNNIFVDEHYIFKRSKVACQRIKALDNGLLHATAVGGVQFSKNPAQIEREAEIIWDNFVNAADCGGEDRYYHVQGKPLLVVYAHQNERNSWASYTGSKSFAERFTIRWCQGGVDGSPDVNKFGSFYGWAVPASGSIPNNDAMVVMPGWNNHKGTPRVERNGVDFYTRYGWDVVFETVRSCWSGHTVIINSFNEYGEETAVAPTDTSRLITPEYNAPWKSVDIFWQLTLQRIAEYKCV